MCPELIESRKVANLPNHHNGIHEEMRFASLRAERMKVGRPSFDELSESTPDSYREAPGG
ncbi:hypothetical protein MARINOS108_11822 [Marinoscillum sp. 108]|nr:hypothetical protein MARINOS108_11822 [Marinoscillum sp. 108]